VILITPLLPSGGDEAHWGQQHLIAYGVLALDRLVLIMVIVQFACVPPAYRGWRRNSPSC
jgi:hypothetical protein